MVVGNGFLTNFYFRIPSSARQWLLQWDTGFFLVDWQRERERKEQQGKAWHGKAKRGKARQGTARQGTARQSMGMAWHGREKRQCCWCWLASEFGFGWLGVRFVVSTLGHPHATSKWHGRLHGFHLSSWMQRINNPEQLINKRCNQCDSLRRFLCVDLQENIDVSELSAVWGHHLAGTSNAVAWQAWSWNDNLQCAVDCVIRDQCMRCWCWWQWSDWRASKHCFENERQQQQAEREKKFRRQFQRSGDVTVLTSWQCWRSLVTHGTVALIWFARFYRRFEFDGYCVRMSGDGARLNPN